MAVMKEIQRYADIAPTGLMHKAVCDVTLRGFALPAGTLVMANYTSAHRSPEFWAKPDEFYPEHFLDESGQLIEDKEGFMPYGLGQRICPGKELAGLFLLLLLATVTCAFACLLFWEFWTQEIN
jgi:cytochrome P450 family 2 subfamily K